MAGPAGGHAVRVRAGLLLTVLLVTGCAPARPAPPVTVVTFGDSVPAGTACGCTPFPDLYARSLSPSAESDNLAEAGATTPDVRRTMTAILQSVHTLRPGAAVLVFGYWNVIEDGEVSNRKYDAGQRAVAVAATEAGNEAIRRAAGATYVETVTAFKGGTGTADPTGLLAADGDHPNAAGHALLARLAHQVQPTA